MLGENNSNDAKRDSRPNRCALGRRAVSVSSLSFSCTWSNACFLFIVEKQLEAAQQQQQQAEENLTEEANACNLACRYDALVFLCCDTCITAAADRIRVLLSVMFHKYRIFVILLKYENKTSIFRNFVVFTLSLDFGLSKFRSGAIVLWRSPWS